MRKRSKVARAVFIIIAFALLLPACSNYYKEQFDQSGSNLGQRDEADMRALNETRAYGYTHKGKHHQNKTMHLSVDTGTKLTEMEGIHMAHVLITDQNAYVALVLDLSATGTLESGTPHTMFGGDRSGRPFVKNGEVKTEIDAPFTTPDEKNISSKLKQKVALKVRELNPHVVEVFISANEEFNTLLGKYHRLQWFGESLDSHVQQFNDSIERFFPPPANK